MNGRRRSDAAEHPADAAGERPGQLGEQPAHRRRRNQRNRERDPDVAKEADREDPERGPEARANADPVPGPHVGFECTDGV